MNEPKLQLATQVRSLATSPAIQARINEVLGRKAPQFVASLAAVARTLPPDTEPQSIIMAAIAAATLDLPIQKDLGFAWIIPYGGKAQFQMGYKGYCQLGLRTGQYQTINTCEVCEGELISYDKLTGDLKLDPSKKTSDNIIGYAAYFRLVNGFEKAIYWPKEKVLAHAQRFSQAYRAKKKDSPWVTDFDSMAMKTVLKNLLSKWGILSVEMQKAHSIDGAVIKDMEAEEIEHPDNQAAEAKVVESELVKEKEDDLVQ